MPAPCRSAQEKRSALPPAFACSFSPCMGSGAGRRRIGAFSLRHTAVPQINPPKPLPIDRRWARLDQNDAALRRTNSIKNQGRSSMLDHQKPVGAKSKLSRRAVLAGAAVIPLCAIRTRSANAPDPSTFATTPRTVGSNDDGKWQHCHARNIGLGAETRKHSRRC